MIQPWFPRKKWRTEVWHIQDEEHNQKGHLFFYYEPTYDEIGVDTGRGHIMQCESWPSFRHSKPSDQMAEAEALKLLGEIEAECDGAHKREKYYLSYSEIGEDYHNARPYREHPAMLAESATRLENDATSLRPLQFKAAAGKSSPQPAKAEAIDDTTWRTEAFLVENNGFRPFKYTTFCELRAHPDPDKERKGLMLFVTWRMGEKSLYCSQEETGFQRALERIHYFEYEHRECKPASPAQTGPLALPPEYAKAQDYHTHPLLNPGDLVVRRKIAPLKTIKFKS